jgi:hypothetical protein
VLLAIAAVVGAERDPEGSVEAALTTRLCNSGVTLLVLDNMEHVLPAAGALYGLLDRLPDLRLLVSSRLPLRVDPERVIALDALDDRSALELIDRAAERHGKRPKLADADRDALREIVVLLDGLPLALEEAAARLDEARMVGSPVDANALYSLDTHLGDLAIFAGRPADALEPFARSLEHALADGIMMQITFDLFGVAEALAALGHDSESLEVAGMAESQDAEIGAKHNIWDYEHLAALEQRVAPAKATELKQPGHAVDPAERVARAWHLARSHASAPTGTHD